jgi:uncharacterized membrane protein YhaH (DUF805 family)
MNFLQAFASGFKKYAVFSGRASRSEYWYWILFYALGQVVIGILIAGVVQTRNPTLGSSAVIVSNVFSLIMFLPSLAVEVRRLHDVNRSGWWLLMNLSMIGMIYPLLVWKCRKGTVGPNRFGDDQLGMDWVVSQFD